MRKITMANPKPEDSDFLKKVLYQIGRHLGESDWGRALAVAWSLLRGAEEQFNEYSTVYSVDNCITNQDELVSLLMDFAIDCHDGVLLGMSTAGNELYARMAQQPFCLVYALDWMLMHGAARADGTFGVSHGAANGFAGPFQLSPAQFDCLLSTPKDPRQRYWLIRNRIATPLSPTEEVRHHPQHFLRHWRIVEELLEGSYVTEVQSTPQLQRGRDASGLPLTQIKIMTANFPIIEFDSVITNLPNGDKAWRTTGLKNLEQVIGWVVDYIQLAVKENVAVLMFPELTVPQPILEVISEELRSMATGSSLLQMVIAGSFHFAKDATAGPGATDLHAIANYQNRAAVFDSNGQIMEMFSHTKLQYVNIRDKSGKRLIEDIAVAKVLRLVDTPWGIQTVVICLDFAQGDGTGLPWATLPVNWVWVPAMSREDTPFIGPAKTIALANTSVVAVANQASADFGGAELGGVIGHSGFVQASRGLDRVVQVLQPHVQTTEIKNFTWQKHD